MVSLKIPNKPEYVKIVRQITLSVANHLNFSDELRGDLEVAVSEACSNVIYHAYNSNSIQIDFLINQTKVIIVVKDHGEGFNQKSLYKDEKARGEREGGLGVFLISALMDEVEYVTTEGEGTEVRMTKYIRN